MNATLTTLEPALQLFEKILITAETTFNKLPGSAVIQRYVQSSHQNDPGRSILELILFAFAVRTLLQSRTRADKHFIKFTDKVFLKSILFWFLLTRDFLIIIPGNRRAH